MPAKVKPPRCSFKVGCLSTRSPHRPNAIGLSVVQVLKVGTDFIEISCVDMIDGTPVLDGISVSVAKYPVTNVFLYSVKPYIPYDLLSFDKSIPMLSWAHSDGNRSSIELNCPNWIYEADIPFRRIVFSSSSSDETIEKALELRRHNLGPNYFCAANNVTETKKLIEQVL